MAKRETIEKIRFDSTRSVLERSAAGAINLTRRKNGHVDKDAAWSFVANIVPSSNEALNLIDRVVHDANDIEWHEKED